MDAQFSSREKEVVDLLLQGKSNKQMALTLDISVRTVEFHLKNIYKKLQVTSRAEAILHLGKTTASENSTVKQVESTVDRGMSSAENDRNIFPVRRIPVKQNYYIVIGSVLAIFLVTAAIWISINPNVIPYRPATATETSVAAHAETTGTEIKFGGTTFTIPAGLGDRALSENVPQSDYYAALWPAYRRSVVENYPLKNTTYLPQVAVFVTPEYARMDPDAAATINELQTIVKTQQVQADEPLPFLPLTRGAAQVFHDHEKFLSFQNGSGIRYITLYSQAAFPIQNLSHLELLYTFQGISDDGNFYVSVMMPVSLEYVTVDETADSPFPENGIPFNWDNPNPDDYPNYLETAVAMIDHQNNPFNPSIEELDTLVQSVIVGVEE